MLTFYFSKSFVKNFTKCSRSRECFMNLICYIVLVRTKLIKVKGGNYMFLIIGFCTMLLLYLIAIITLLVVTFKQGPQDINLKHVKGIAQAS